MLIEEYRKSVPCFLRITRCKIFKVSSLMISFAGTVYFAHRPFTDDTWNWTGMIGCVIVCMCSIYVLANPSSIKE